MPGRHAPAPNTSPAVLDPSPLRRPRRRNDGKVAGVRIGREDGFAERLQPTNNGAEQALRTIVLKRKISGPTRSRCGDEFIARGFSAFETCRRQRRDFIGYMHGAVIAWIDKTIPPSLLPALVPTG